MNTPTNKMEFSAVVHPDCTITFEGHRYQSPHFANLAGQRVFPSGQFHGGKVRSFVLPSGNTVRVSREGEELPPPSRLESFCLAVGIISA